MIAVKIIGCRSNWLMKAVKHTKNRSTWTQAHLAFWHIIKSPKLSFNGSCICQSTWCLREVSIWTKNNAHKVQKISYSGIMPFMYAGKEEILKNMWYEVSMTVYMGRIANQRKTPNWLPIKNYKSESLNIGCAYVGAHICKTWKCVLQWCFRLESEWTGHIDSRFVPKMQLNSTNFANIFQNWVYLLV